jgi:hypothetical protein|tara:strand:- start:741 stop:944 length:204 start_codon:yes stop_codon:yes gene_type:complete
MPMLNRSHQIAMAVISASTGHANSQQIAKESLKNAQTDEYYDMATDNDRPQVKMSISKQGVYTFRTY